MFKYWMYSFLALFASLGLMLFFAWLEWMFMAYLCLVPAGVSVCAVYAFGEMAARSK